ncbi:MAG: zinc dependent phospholipase C family protein, partial [Eubacteriaceae bacterium]|nr:zinc dependent phospholipase C family protein [Eubacteriaceae bacterium]
MKLKSHISIANNIANLLEEHLDIKIDRDSLALGAVHPDMHIARRVRIHNLDQVLKNYQIQTNNFINQSKNKFSISFSMGMLSHYICDTFCMAHNKKIRRYSDFKEHVRYELALSQVISEYEVCGGVLAGIRHHVDKCTDFDVSSFLLELKQEYLFKSESNDLQEQLSADIRYSIVASVIV